jgi:myo-inositol 2-dehydrogenase / D-chiro-inositol 1-dehydrogenase
MKHQSTQEASRRTFLRYGTVAVAGSALAVAKAGAVHAAGDDVIKVALIGCGARGAGAAVQALTTDKSVKLWAMADAFQDRLDGCLTHMKRGLQASYDRSATGGMADQIDVPPERQFIGLDAYRKAIDSGVDVVLLIEPPGFRPKHFEYAVGAGKHVFMEKPVATDVAGVHRVLAAAKEADKKGLKVGVGLQRRHQGAYLEGIQRVHDGEIGDLFSLRCYWNSGWPAKTPVPRGDMSELEYQVRNWYFFNWLSGDHICEQHVHNLDVCNWIKQAHPIEAQGQGGRQVRTGKEYGNIFDHHSVEFTYDDDVRMFSQCRQTPDCWSHVGEYAQGAKGRLELSGVAASIFAGKERIWRTTGGAADKRRGPYQAEHNALFNAIRSNQPYNEAEYGALSTMTGILGRMATYTGKVVTWDEAFNSGERLTTEAETWDADAPVKSREDGRYPVAIPGVTTIV